MRRFAFKAAYRLPLHFTVYRGVGQLGRVFIRVDFLHALIAEVRANNNVSLLNRVPITPDASDEIEIEARTILPLPFKYYRLGRFHAIIGIGELDLSLLPVLYRDFLVWEIFHTISRGIQLILKRRIGRNVETKRRADLLAKLVGDQVDTFGRINRFAIRELGHRPFSHDAAFVRQRSDPVIGFDLDLAKLGLSRRLRRESRRCLLWAFGGNGD